MFFPDGSKYLQYIYIITFAFTSHILYIEDGAVNTCASAFDAL